MNIQSLCTPAKIYFFLAILSSIIALFNQTPILAVFMNLVFAFLWSYGLNWLCSKGYKAVSWFLVLFPYIVIILAMFRIINLAQKNQLQQIQRVMPPTQMDLIHQPAM
jgi:hypothetical protein